MRIGSPRTQRGITLIEIILVMAIVVAATAAIFVFSKKASVTAAVETEQRQVEQIATTVEGLFAFQRNFAALGTDGASYLKQHAARSGLKFTTNADGTAAMETGLGDGYGTLTIAAADVGFTTTGPVAPGTANGFILAYDGLKPSECIGLVTSTAARTVKTVVGYGGTMPALGVGEVALRGALDTDKGKIAERCKEQAGASPTVFLFFARQGMMASTPAPAPTPAAACNPVHESQYTACPAGQVGTIRQERDGACTGPNNAMVYTIWTTMDDTCQVAPVAPVSQTTTDPAASCVTSTFTMATACPAGQTGQITQQRTLDSCTGVYSPWTTTSTACQSTAAATCTPSTQERTQLCSAGQTGAISQSRSSTCDTPTSAPRWVVDPTTTDAQGWQDFSNTCQGSATCSPQRAAGPIPCAAGQYGAWQGERERFRSCLNATTQGAWSGWSILTPNNGCANCPPTVTETAITWSAASSACPAGYTGSQDWEYESVSTRPVSYNCPTGTTTLPAPSYGTWSGAAATGATRNYVDSCVPATCSGSPNDTQWVSSSAACPSGYTGSNTWEREQSRSRVCTAGTWSAWGAWSNTGSTRNVVNTCAVATCSGSSTGTQWLGASAACPAGQAGSNTWEYEQTQSRTCNAGTWSAWGAWTNTGATRNAINTCAAVTCAGSATNTQWLASSAACPATTWGTHTWEREQLQSRTCTAGTWGAFGAWSNTGVTRNVNNTCTNCGSAAGTQVVWQARSQACPTGYTGSHTWEEQRNQSRTGTYSCPAGTTSLPAPTWGAWVNGSWTGTKRNEVNTCAPTPPKTCGSWSLVSYSTAPNWGSLKGEYIEFDDGAGGTCSAGWGWGLGPGTPATQSDRDAFKACEDMQQATAKPLGPNAYWAFSEFSDWGGIAENNEYWEGPAVCP